MKPTETKTTVAEAPKGFGEKCIALWKGLVQTWKTALEVNSTIFAIDKRYAVISWTESVVGSLGRIGAITLFGLGVGEVVDGLVKTKKFDITLLIIVGVVMVLWKMGQQAAKAWIQNFRSRFQTNFNTRMREVRIQKMLTLDVGRLTQSAFIELKDSAVDQGGQAIRDLFEAQQSFVGNCIKLIGVFGLVVALDSFLVFVALLPIIPEAICSLRIRRRSQAAWIERRPDRMHRSLFSRWLDEVEKLTQTKLLEKVPFVWGKLVHYNDRLAASELEMQNRKLREQLWLTVFSGLVFGISCAYLGYKILEGELSIGEMLILFNSLDTFRYALNSGIDDLVGLYSGDKDYDYHRRFMQTKPLIKEFGTRTLTLSACPDLHFHGVHFGYPVEDSASVPVLTGCTFSIPAGQKVAIVGGNGSGKSTAMHLATRRYLPDAGSILVGDTPLSEVTSESWLSHIAYMTQSYFVPGLEMDMVITSENREEIDLERFREATRIAGLDDFVLRLPDQYHTRIGSQWPGGKEFSGGQRQRIVLASLIYRLLRSGIHIGIFDEPMASCDKATKDRFYRAIMQLTDRTIILVVHEPMYLHLFDRILVFKDGNVVEDITGTAEIAAFQKKQLGSAE